MAEREPAQEPPPTYSDLAQVIRSSTGVTVDPDAIAGPPPVSFAELGVDSLGVLGVVAALENRHGVRLGADAVTCERPDQLRELMIAAMNQEDTDARTH